MPVTVRIVIRWPEGGEAYGHAVAAARRVFGAQAAIGKPGHTTVMFQRDAAADFRDRLRELAPYRRRPRRRP